MSFLVVCCDKLWSAVGANEFSKIPVIPKYYYYNILWNPMFFLYLSIHRKTKDQYLVVTPDKRAIFSLYPNDVYMNEFLEACKDEFNVKVRLPIIQRSYPRTHIDSCIRTTLSLKERIRLGFKMIWHFSDGVRLERSIRMIENNPNKNGLSQEHKDKIAASKRGKPSGRLGKKASAETLERMSRSASGNKACAGLMWCHEPISGKHRRVKSHLDVPEGWILGRDPGYMAYARSHWRR